MTIQYYLKDLYHGCACQLAKFPCFRMEYSYCPITQIMITQEEFDRLSVDRKAVGKLGRFQLKADLLQVDSRQIEVDSIHRQNRFGASAKSI